MCTILFEPIKKSTLHQSNTTNLSVNAKTVHAVIHANVRDNHTIQYLNALIYLGVLPMYGYNDRQPISGGRDNKAAREEMTVTKVRWRLVTEANNSSV